MQYPGKCIVGESLHEELESYKNIRSAITVVVDAVRSLFDELILAIRTVVSNIYKVVELMIRIAVDHYRKHRKKQFVTKEMRVHAKKGFR